MRGKLIIIESGSDGSGKATQTEKLFTKLKGENYKIKKVSYPNYESPACMPVKMYLNGDFGNKPDDVNAYVASTFYAIDRFASFKKDWEDFYNEGGIIIADRYTTSNMVHQASKMSIDKRDEYLDWLYNLEFELYGLPKPDAVIFLDVAPEVSQELMKDRANKITGEQEKDIHEKDTQYLINSYNNAKFIADKYNWIKIDCVQDGKLLDIERIHEKIYSSIKTYL
ncbi:MAG: thymidylate kinase [Romboutsia sp.]|nr:thymidylate kinase [Romboutsia sp.]